MSRVVVATGADDAFALPMLVTVYSAAVNLRPGEGMDVYVLDGGLTAASRDRVAAAVARAGRDVRVRYVNPRVDVLAAAGLPVAGIGLMTYLRLLVPDSLPADVTHAIYLDSDLLVRASLADLWAVRPAAAMAGVPDYGGPVVSSPSCLPNWRELGLPADAPYLNAGVLVMNLAAWRAGGLGRRVLEYCVRHKDINRYADQDGINALLCRAAEPIDPLWNVPAYLAFDHVVGHMDPSPVKDWVAGRRAEVLRAARVIHFIGRRKPWTRGLGSAAQWEWLRYASRSGWFRGRPWAFARLVAVLAVDAAARTGVRYARATFPRPARRSA